MRKVPNRFLHLLSSSSLSSVTLLDDGDDDDDNGSGGSVCVRVCHFVPLRITCSLSCNARLLPNSLRSNFPVSLTALRDA